MAKIQKECIFYNKRKEECNALNKLYCATEDRCGFCKLKEEYDKNGVPLRKERE